MAFLQAVGHLIKDPRATCRDRAQGLMAIVIALSGKYEQILNYVVSVDSSSSA